MKAGSITWQSFVRLCSRMGYGAVLAFVLVSYTKAQAQALGDWAEGTVILNDGDTLSGKIYINLDEDLVEVEYMSAIKTYTPMQVLLVRLYDPLRLYASHPAALRGTMQVPTLFEVLQPGAFATLLTRERIGPNNQPVYDQYGQPIGTFYGAKNYRYDFFILTAQGRVRRMPIRRADLAKFLDPNPAAALVDYIRRNKPNPKEKPDMVALISFYNHLKAEQLPPQR